MDFYYFSNFKYLFFSQIEWTLNNELINEYTPGIKISSTEFFDFSVTIDNVKQGGTIKCRAANIQGTVETQGKLIVVEKATFKAPPEFEKPLNEIIEGREGEPLNVKIVATQAEVIKWYRNGERLKVF